MLEEDEYNQEYNQLALTDGDRERSDSRPEAQRFWTRHYTFEGARESVAITLSDPVFLRVCGEKINSRGRYGRLT